MRTTAVKLALVVGTCLSTPALAQTGSHNTAVPGKSTSQESTVAPLTAAAFVEQAGLGNMFEIQSGQIAAEKARNDQVKAFGQKLVKDHNQAQERLKTAGQPLPNKLDDDHQRTVNELRNANGPIFDRRFVQAQISAHQQAIQLYDRYAQNGDNKPLKQLAQDLLPTLRDHLQTAQNLQNSLPPDRISENQGQNDQGPQAQASQIVVQQPAPTIHVQQGAPTVSVRQPQPNVTVTQPRPQISIRQPQPTVTIDIPQPVVTIRMPQPDVNVSMAQPEVQVNQPPPHVQVVGSQGKPQVQLDRDQPQIQVQSASGRPQVNVQQQTAQPQVTYQREQPRVVVNQPQGQPTIHFEQMAAGQDQQPGQRQAQEAGSAGQSAHGSRSDRAVAAAQQTQGNASSMPAETRQLDPAILRNRINSGSGDETGSVANTATSRRNISISQLEDMDVYNGKGNQLGEVDRVVTDNQGKEYIVIGNGGFLGFGRDRVAFPVDRFWLRGDRLVIRGVTEQDIENSDNYHDQYDGLRRLADNDHASLRVWQR